jgi:hypothetical protein
MFNYTEKNMIDEMRKYACSDIPHEIDSPNNYNGSEWNEKIPFNAVKECCDRIFTLTTEEEKIPPIISVGSGNGKLEKYLIENDYPNIICIDPKVFSHNVDKILHIKPEYDNVDEIIVKKPEVVGNCFLMIIYPSQEGTPDSGYDIEAIRKLNPRRILVLYENIGYSGSYELIKFLDNPGKEWFGMELINVQHFRLISPVQYVVKILQHVRDTN